jgi:hypothetical protein
MTCAVNEASMTLNEVVWLSMGWQPTEGKAMKRVLICAGDQRQAETLARALRIPKSECSYVDRIEKMLGYRGVTMLMLGTWRERKDIKEIIDHAHAREMTILYISDDRS